MSMSDEHAAEFKNEVAVVCCRTESGTIITAANLEDPTIFPDLVDSGLLTIPENCLKIGQVIGAKLTKTIDSLVPLTPEIVEGVIAIAEDAKVADSVDSTPEAPNMVEGVVEETPVMSSVMNGGILKIKISEGKGIDIEIPLNSFNQSTAQAVETVKTATTGMAVAKEAAKENNTPEVKFEDKVVRELVKKHFKIEEVKFGPETKIEGTVLYIRENI
ncbi:D-proline reductase (dithiol) proprotein PrdA, partial [Clostridium bowmanii]|nr:D-proline reductase (dithiol) proprotein PrdA [Clostridium bowmanii]